MNTKLILKTHQPNYATNLIALEEIEYLEKYIKNMQKILLNFNTNEECKHSYINNISENLNKIIILKNTLKNQTPSSILNSIALKEIESLETIATNLRNYVKKLMNSTLITQTQ